MRPSPQQVQKNNILLIRFHSSFGEKEVYACRGLSGKTRLLIKEQIWSFLSINGMELIWLYTKSWSLCQVMCNIYNLLLNKCLRYFFSDRRKLTKLGRRLIKCSAIVHWNPKGQGATWQWDKSPDYSSSSSCSSSSPQP